MFKKVFSFSLAAVMLISAVGCGKKATDVKTNSSPVSDVVIEEEKFAVNPLTGIKNLDKNKTNIRPVAVMIDNDALAQQYSQSGVSKADIVYETEAEGGITRLMAVYEDISKAPQIGDVRSARYVFVDLAMQHKAIYVHSGMDETYCKPHLSGIDNFEITTGNYGERKTYGQVRSWQTLFTTGETLLKGFSDRKWKTTDDSISSWQKFEDEEKNISLSAAANKIVAPFNSSYITEFTYDAASGNYIKTSSKAKNADRNDSAPYSFKNVFILQTSMSMYPDNKHRKVDLVSGTGYYAVNGTYEKINWKKGDTYSPFVFTKEDGTELKVNAGTSWVCIINKSSSVSVS